MRQFLKYAALVPLIVVTCVVVDALGQSGDTYHPTFYPNADNLLVFERGPVFRTEAGARDWLDAQYFARDWPDGADHEVGVNCHSWQDYMRERGHDSQVTADELEVCQETIK